MLSDPPILTVGLPVYNGMPYISAALDALVKQTRSDFLVIISDNASTDGTSEVLRAYADRDSRLTVVTQKKNLGALGNFQFVLQSAKTPYFMWTAADDILSRDWIEKLLPIAQSGDCLAFGAVDIIDAAGRTIPNQSSHRNYAFSGTRLWRRIRFFLEPAAMGKANPIYGIFRKDLFTDAIWAEFSKFRNASDAISLYAFLGDARIAQDPSAVLFKRSVATSTANDPDFVPKKRRYQVRLFKRTQLPEYLKLSDPVEKLAIIVFYPIAVLGIYWAKIIRARRVLGSRVKK